MNYRFLKEKNRYLVVLDGVEYEVSKEVYRVLDRSYDNEKKYEIRWGKRSLSINYEYENGGNLSELLVDNKHIEPEGYVLQEEMCREMKEFVEANLSAREQEILQFVVLDGMTEQMYSDSIGCSRTTINYQKRKMLQKLKKFFEKR